VGEAKRRRVAYDTLDGGPPSDDRIVVQLEAFAPLRGVVGDDRLYLKVMREAYARAHLRPTPICGACDYEFAFGECPPLLYCTRPFIAKGESHTVISGAICPQCAALPADDLMQALSAHLREVKPDIALLQGGQA
jgi:hypothetical protein